MKSVVFYKIQGLCVYPGDGGVDPAVTAVSVSPATPGLVLGGTQQFTADVTGTNNPAQTVIWSVEGGVFGTAINVDGLLSVAAGETVPALTVRATSTVDTRKSGVATVTVSGGNTLNPDIDVALLGTWKDKPVVPGYSIPGDILTVTFTETTVTWGGSAGNTLNTTLSIYQVYGSYAWEAKNGNINLVYIDPTLGRQSYTCYTYLINGNGELELKVSGYTFATLAKNGADTTPW